MLTVSSGNKWRDSLTLMTLMICNMIGVWITAITFTTFPIVICLVPVFFSTSGMMLMSAMVIAVEDVYDNILTDEHGEPLTDGESDG